MTRRPKPPPFELSAPATAMPPPQLPLDAALGVQVVLEGADFVAVFDPASKTLTISALIPGITAESRLVFMTRRVNDARTTILSDRICD